MASMIISTYLSLLPQKTVLFCAIVLCIGFFGIFLPYQEHKKKKRQRQKSQPKPPASAKRIEQAVDQNKLDQLKALKSAGLLSEEEYREKKRGMR